MINNESVGFLTLQKDNVKFQSCGKAFLPFLISIGLVCNYI